MCALHPEAKVSIKKQNSPADELKAEQAAIIEALDNGTLETFASMEEYEGFIEENLCFPSRDSPSPSIGGCILYQ